MAVYTESFTGTPGFGLAGLDLSWFEPVSNYWYQTGTQAEVRGTNDDRRAVADASPLTADQYAEVDLSGLVLDTQYQWGIVLRSTATATNTAIAVLTNTSVVAAFKIENNVYSQLGGQIAYPITSGRLRAVLVGDWLRIFHNDVWIGSRNVTGIDAGLSGIYGLNPTAAAGIGFLESFEAGDVEPDDQGKLVTAMNLACPWRGWETPPSYTANQGDLFGHAYLYALEPVPSGGPIVVLIGTGVESDSAPPLTPIVAPKDIPLGTAIESDSAPGLTVTVAPVNVPLGVASESDSAPPLTVLADEILVPLAAATESDSAPGLSITFGSIAVQIGTGVESDSAPALTPVLGGQVVVLNTASETDSAPALQVVGGALTVQLGTAIETDSAPALRILGEQIVSLGVASEIDTAPDLRILAGIAGLVRVRNVTISGPYSPASISGPYAPATIDGP